MYVSAGSHQGAVRLRGVCLSLHAVSYPSLHPCILAFPMTLCILPSCILYRTSLLHSSSLMDGSSVCSKQRGYPLRAHCQDAPHPHRRKGSPSSGRIARIHPFPLNQKDYHSRGVLPGFLESLRQTAS